MVQHFKNLDNIRASFKVGETFRSNRSGKQWTITKISNDLIGLEYKLESREVFGYYDEKHYNPSTGKVVREVSWKEFWNDVENGKI